MPVGVKSLSKSNAETAIMVNVQATKEKQKGRCFMANSLAHTKWVCKYHIVFTPKYSISQFMGYLKGKSAMMIFERHANLKYKFGNRNFWATGYYVSTVGINTATVQKYIREQEKQDQIEDSLSRKEYKDPFKGSK